MDQEFASDDGSMSDNSDNLLEALPVIHQGLSTRRYLFRSSSLRKTNHKVYEIDLGINSPLRRAAVGGAALVAFLNDSEVLEKRKMISRPCTL